MSDSLHNRVSDASIVSLGSARAVGINGGARWCRWRSLNKTGCSGVFSAGAGHGLLPSGASFLVAVYNACGSRIWSPTRRPSGCLPNSPPYGIPSGARNARCSYASWNGSSRLDARPTLSRAEPQRDSVPSARGAPSTTPRPTGDSVHVPLGSDTPVSGTLRQAELMNVGPLVSK